MQLFTCQDGDQGEVEDVFKVLKESKKEMNPAVVRLKDDREYFEFIKKLNEHLQTAQGLATMVAGTIVPTWQLAALFPDGTGWRVLLNWQPITAQVQGMPQGHNGKGLRGLKG